MRELYLCFQDVAQLDVVPAALYRALLERHRAALAASGLDPERVATPPALWAQRARVPIELVDTLHRLGTIADDTGVDAIVQAAGGPLFAGPLDRVPVVFALRTWLEHPAVFDRALGRRFADPIRAFREFEGTARRTPDDLDVSDLADGLRMALGGTDCTVHLWTERDGSHLYAIEYAARQWVERDEHGNHRIVAGPPRYDLVIYEPRRGRLRVFSDDARVTAVLVSEFGLALCGTGDGFRDAVRVSLEPLLVHRSAALEPTPGVLGATVVEIEIASRCLGNEVTIVRGEDVLHHLSEPTTPIDRGPLRAARLRLRLRGERRQRDVVLRYPDGMAWDWRRGNSVIRGFLEERGFVEPPGGGASWQAA